MYREDQPSLLHAQDRREAAEPRLEAWETPRGHRPGHARAAARERSQRDGIAALIAIARSENAPAEYLREAVDTHTDAWELLIEDPGPPAPAPAAERDARVAPHNGNGLVSTPRRNGNGSVSAPPGGAEAPPGADGLAGGRHRQPQQPVSAASVDLARRHWAKFIVFSAIGGGVFLAGLAIQVVLVKWMRIGAVPAYIVQGVASIQLSFVLNRYLTWRDRSVAFWRALWRFNAQKFITALINIGAYAGLVHLGMQYIAANVALTAVFTPANYALGHVWSFASRRRTSLPPIPDSPRLPRICPTVSVVIPCKDNPGTIRETVEALLDQSYPALEEVILVGSTGDSTWAGLAGINDPRLVIVEQEPVPGRRDPAIKRHKGLSQARGQVLALADSDIVMEPTWLAKSVALLLAQGGGCVAGGMRSISNTFWGRFVDRNSLGAKTPRIPVPYLVTSENFGKRGTKPPVTANVVFSRDVYRDCAFDPLWTYGYEDYEWFWRIARSGHKILVSHVLAGRHHHRGNFRDLAREYLRSSEGAAQFTHAHPDSPLSRKRLLQALALPVLGAAGAAAAGYALAAGDGIPLVAASAFALLLLAGRELVKARTIEGVVYPFIALTLAALFTVGLAWGLVRASVSPRRAPQAVRPATGPPLPWWQRSRWPLLAVLAVQALLSLRLIWTNTAFQDEAEYLWIGHLEWAHWLHGAPMPTVSLSGSLVVYPPLGALADSAGGLAGARILSLLVMIMATVLLYATANKLFGRGAGIFAAGLFVSIGPAADLGAWATYDPLAVFFLALAGWLAARSHGRAGELWLLGTAVAMLLADATKYASALWNPVVVAIVIFAADGKMTIAWARGVRVTSYLFAELAFALFVLGGKSYVKMITSSTTNRRVRSVPPLVVLENGIPFVALVLVLAAIGIAVVWRRPWRVRLLAISLTAAAILAPVEEAHLQTIVSLYKHVVYGGWFAAILAGYTLSRAAEVNPIKGWRIGFATAFFGGLVGFSQASGLYGYWPPASGMVSALARYLPAAHGQVLMQNGDASVADYYLYHRGMTVNLSTSYVYPPSVLTAMVSSHYFSLIEVQTGVGGSLQKALKGHTAAGLRQAGYQLVASVPWQEGNGPRGNYQIWRSGRGTTGTGASPGLQPGQKAVR